MLRYCFAALLACIAPIAAAVAAPPDGVAPSAGSAHLRIEKLWETAVRPEGVPVIAENVVLVPCGLRIIALDALTGAEAWRYALAEDRAGLEVPARVRGIAATRLRPGQGIAIAIGSTEIHGLALFGGRALWKHRERTACTLALSIVADADGDGVRDAVVSGCDSVACVSSVSGAALWHYPISGRSWWTADAGDLDGDGRGEVLVYASGTLHAVRSTSPGIAAPLWSLAVPLQPRTAFPQPRGVVLLFPTAAIERRAGGDGALVWRVQTAGGRIADARLSPDGRDLLLAAEGSIASVALGNAACSVLGRCGASAGAFIPERAQLILGFADGAMAVFDCVTRAERARTRIAAEPVETILASHDGLAIVLTARRAIAVRVIGGAAER